MALIKDPTIAWAPAMGFAHAVALLSVGPTAGKDIRVSATRSAALNLAASCMFSAEACLWWAGIKPMPVAAAPALILPDGAQVVIPGFDPGPLVLGGSESSLTSDDLDFGAAKSVKGGVRTTARRAAAMCYLATQRSVRQLVDTSRIIRQGAGLTAGAVLDDAFVVPGVTPGIEGMGALPIGLIIVVACVASVAIAAYAWNDVEKTGQLVGLKRTEAITAAEVKAAVDLCALQIAAGGECDVPDVIASMSKAERSDGTIVPIVAVGGALALVAGLVAWRYHQRRGRALVAA